MKNGSNKSGKHEESGRKYAHEINRDTDMRNWEKKSRKHEIRKYDDESDSETWSNRKKLGKYEDDNTNESES